MAINFDDSKQRAEVAKVADQILQDPLKLRLLCDRVHQLLTDDMRQQKERAGRHYEGRL
jgi:alpha-D-ribose 1-methylphosphonate 5-triphosphate synthase subunit PhnG